MQTQTQTQIYQEIHRCVLKDKSNSKDRGKRAELEIRYEEWANLGG
jgi:hypothetical protein